ncbi:hypothetical protein OSTOST_18607 [Ostertagia ostertagi]
MYAERPWTTCANEANLATAKPTTPVFSTYHDQGQVNAYHLFPPSALRQPVAQKASVTRPPIVSSYLIDIPSYGTDYYMGNGPNAGKILNKEVDNIDVYPRTDNYQSPMVIEQSYQAPKCLPKNIFVATPDANTVSPSTAIQEAATPMRNSTGGPWATSFYAWKRDERVPHTDDAIRLDIGIAIFVLKEPGWVSATLFVGIGSKIRL